MVGFRRSRWSRKYCQNMFIGIVTIRSLSSGDAEQCGNSRGPAREPCGASCVLAVRRICQMWLTLEELSCNMQLRACTKVKCGPNSSGFGAF